LRSGITTERTMHPTRTPRSRETPSAGAICAVLATVAISAVGVAAVLISEVLR
jgi:hypothetical protein